MPGAEAKLLAQVNGDVADNMITICNIRPKVDAKARSSALIGVHPFLSAVKFFSPVRHHRNPQGIPPPSWVGNSDAGPDATGNGAYVSMLHHEPRTATCGPPKRTTPRRPPGSPRSVGHEWSALRRDRRISCSPHCHRAAYRS